jgi:hypothetical protein
VRLLSDGSTAGLAVRTGDACSVTLDSESEGAVPCAS